jgi:beta-galactosidase/beta-glucuronidase
MCRTTTMPTRAAITVVVLLATLLSPPASFALAARSDLSGQWALQLDPSDAGMKEKWFAAALPAALPIELPGSLQSQGFGNDIAIDTAWTGSIVDRSWFTAPQFEKYRQPGQIKAPFWLQPDKHYVGAAWYQRSVQLPTAWNGRRLVLHLERPHWETRVWIDDREAGICNALGTPHQIDLTHALAAAGGGAGRPHRLTIRVDNAVKVAVGVNAHSVTDHTQSNWNGIVGAIELRATDRVWIDDLQVYPDLAGKCVTVRGRIGTHTGSAGSGTLTLSAERVTSPATLSNGSVRAPRLTPLSILGPGFCCTWPWAPPKSAI